MRRAVLALTAILVIVFLIAPIAQLSVVEANPVPYPSEPSQEFPTIEVYSPKDGELFNDTQVAFNFNVTKPESWDYYWMSLSVVGTYFVNVYLDGTLLRNESGHQSFGVLEQSYSSTSGELTKGSHKVEVRVTAYAHYAKPNNENGYLDDVRIISKTVNFMVNADPPTPTPSVPEFSWLMILPLFAFVLVCVVLVRFRNRINKNAK